MFFRIERPSQDLENSYGSDMHHGDISQLHSVDGCPVYNASPLLSTDHVSVPLKNLQRRTAEVVSVVQYNTEVVPVVEARRRNSRILGDYSNGSFTTAVLE